MPQSVTINPAGEVLDTTKSASYRVHVSGREFAISSEGFRLIAQDIAARREFIAAATSFRSFLDHWHFTPPGSPPRVLGADLWAAQDAFVSTVERESFVYFLKARQLGETTIECAFDAWIARFGGLNSRAHIFCQRDQNAVEFLQAVVFGLESLPPALRLPMRASAHTLTLNAGPGDKRTVKAYPANAATRGSTCNHAHVDELAAMVDPLKVWAAIEPTVQPGGSIHVLTTGAGPVGFAADFWRAAVAGESEFAPCFCNALMRPDRSPEWLESKRRSTDARTFACEYPMTPEDALAGAGEYLFEPEKIDLASFEALGCYPTQRAYESDRRSYHRASPRRRYVGGIDIGTVDATVITILDATREPYQVVGWYYLCPATIGSIQNLVRQAHLDWPDCHFLLEDNGPGGAVRANVRVPESHCQGFTTTLANKQRMIGELEVHVHNEWIMWSAKDCPQLDAEMRSYRGPSDDKTYAQDCVMSLGLALEAAASSSFPELGRIVGVILV